MYSNFCCRQSNIRSSAKWRYNAQLLEIRRLLARAYRASRSGAVRQVLKQAKAKADELQKELQLDTVLSSNSLTSTATPVEVETSWQIRNPFEEKYFGNGMGYPYFYEGYVLTKSNDSKPWPQLLSILLTMQDCMTVKQIVSDFMFQKPPSTFQISYLDIPLHMLTPVVCAESTHLPFPITGSLWKSYLQTLQSDFVLIGREMTHFNWFARVDRLIEVMHSAKIEIAGGASRNEAGHWRQNCYQMGLKNYTLKLVAGYDLSYKSCAFCDYLHGPFIARRQLLIDTLHDTLSGEALFLDFFMRLAQNNPPLAALSCADVLFHVKDNDLSNTFSTNKLKSLAALWHLNRVALPGVEHKFSCQEAGLSCGGAKTGGIFVPICCLEDLGRHIKDFFTLAKEHGFRSETDSGTTLGLVKLGGILPWELDADVLVDAKYHSNFSTSITDFQALKYSVIQEIGYRKLSVTDCLKNYETSKKYENCAYYDMKKAGYRTEIYISSHLSDYLATSLHLPVNINQTQIYYDGVWIPTPLNPGLNVRNRYGDNIFMHVEHWMTLGKSSSWSSYSMTESGSFETCSKLEFHGCLSNYLTDGNLQFFDLYV